MKEEKQRRKSASKENQSPECNPSLEKALAANSLKKRLILEHGMLRTLGTFCDDYPKTKNGIYSMILYGPEHPIALI